MKKHSTDLKQASGLLTATIASGLYATIADYGAGTGTAGPDLAAAANTKLLRYDVSYDWPGNENLKPLNKEFWDNIAEADVVICANVLNVITDDAELQETIAKLVRAMKASKGKKLLIQVYKAPKPSNTQRAQSLLHYAGLIKNKHPELQAQVKGRTIILEEGKTK